MDSYCLYRQLPTWQHHFLTSHQWTTNSWHLNQQNKVFIVIYWISKINCLAFWHLTEKVFLRTNTKICFGVGWMEWRLETNSPDWRNCSLSITSLSFVSITFTFLKHGLSKNTFKGPPHPHNAFVFSKPKNKLNPSKLPRVDKHCHPWVALGISLAAVDLVSHVPEMSSTPSILAASVLSWSWLLYCRLPSSMPLDPWWLDLSPQLLPCTCFLAYVPPANSCWPSGFLLRLCPPALLLFSPLGRNHLPSPPPSLPPGSLPAQSWGSLSLLDTVHCLIAPCKESRPPHTRPDSASFSSLPAQALEDPARSCPRSPELGQREEQGLLTHNNDWRFKKRALGLHQVSYFRRHFWFWWNNLTPLKIKKRTYLLEMT